MANNQMKHPALNENPECTKKVVSDSLGLVDFAIWAVNSVLNLPEEQVKFFKKFKLQRNCKQCCLSKNVLSCYILATTFSNGKS